MAVSLLFDTVLSLVAIRGYPDGPVIPSEQTILTIIKVCACMVATDDQGAAAARAASGHVAAALPRRVMKERRCIGRPQAQETASYRLKRML
jgi:hypothetical protein